MQDYPNLHAAIKQIGPWWHHLESTWIVSTTDSPQNIFGHLKPHIDQNDRILIVDITNQQREGWLTTEAWQWLVDNGR